ncbi:MAG TPA: GNAT family protein [Gemmatimonadaceae bacterium]
MIALEPVTLEGTHVRLEPLTLAHAEPLAAVALDPVLWRWTLSRVETPAQLRAYVEEALAAQASGTVLPFATVERASGKVVGSTRFGNYSAKDRRVEIGWTFVAPPWQRTAINAEAKLLMLRHAFTVLRCVRVELKANAANGPSCRAILSLGATEEGTLRRHSILPDGTWRDTTYFSILDHEWPAVEERLVHRVRVKGG